MNDITALAYSSAIGSFVIGLSPIEGSSTDGRDDLPGSATDYLHQKILAHTLGFGAYAMPATVYVGLTSTAPNARTAGTEVAGGGYARMPATYAMTARPDLATNTTTLEWPPATGDWGTIGWFEIWDAATGGNRLYWGPLVDPADGVTPVATSIVRGDILRMPANAAQVQAT